MITIILISIDAMKPTTWSNYCSGPDSGKSEGDE